MGELMNELLKLIASAPVEIMGVALGKPGKKAVMVRFKCVADRERTAPWLKEQFCKWAETHQVVEMTDGETMELKVK